MQGKSKRLNFDNYFEVNRSRKSGGLALMWSSGLLVEIKSWIYRVIAKTIANSLNICYTISSFQHKVLCFIPNKLITDNVLIGYECLHKIRLNKGKKWFGGIKVWYK